MVVAVVDPPPILEAFERVLDPEALVEQGAVLKVILSLDFGRDAGGGGLVGQGVAEPGGVTAAVTEHDLGGGRIALRERRFCSRWYGLR